MGRKVTLNKVKLTNANSNPTFQGTWNPPWITINVTPLYSPSRISSLPIGFPPFNHQGYIYDTIPVVSNGLYKVTYDFDIISQTDDITYAIQKNNPAPIVGDSGTILNGVSLPYKISGGFTLTLPSITQFVALFNSPSSWTVQLNTYLIQYAEPGKGISTIQNGKVII